MEHEAVRAAAVPWVGGERAQRFDCASGQGQDAELAGLGRARLQADLWLVAVEVHDIGPAERERLADARAAREQDREERPPPDVGLGLDAVDRARDFAIVEHAVARCDVVLGDAARRVDHPGVEEIPAVARRADDDAQERERLIELAWAVALHDLIEATAHAPCVERVCEREVGPAREVELQATVVLAP